MDLQFLNGWWHVNIMYFFQFYIHYSFIKFPEVKKTNDFLVREIFYLETSCEKLLSIVLEYISFLSSGSLVALIYRDCKICKVK